MARATIIWLVIKQGYPIAAFTVKWQLVEWLEAKLEYYKWHEYEITIVRMHDAQPELPKQYFRIKEILDG